MPNGDVYPSLLQSPYLYPQIPCFDARSVVSIRVGAEQRQVGYDHIDADACTARGIVVGNTPGVLDEAVADHTMALILAAARRIPLCDRFSRGPDYVKYDNMLFNGRSVYGRTIGIVGMGRIGVAVARRVSPF